MIQISKNQTVLFQGDSITDCSRDREAPYSLGNGYAMIASALFSARFPELEVHFLNRGIGGNRVPDLQKRWDEDALKLQPDWISIMIGINDCWRKFDRNDPTSAEEYHVNYRKLLQYTQAELPKTRLIIMEPFVLPFPEDRLGWREDLDPKIQVARKLAREFNALYVPLDGLFAAAACQRPASFWAQDGVHPSPEGHALIARAWLQCIGLEI